MENSRIIKFGGLEIPIDKIEHLGIILSGPKEYSVIIRFFQCSGRFECQCANLQEARRIYSDILHTLTNKKIKFCIFEENTPGHFTTRTTE